MNIPPSSRVVRLPSLRAWTRAGLVLGLSATTLFLGGASAVALTRPTALTSVISSRAFTASLCKKVSPAAVAAIVGYAVPAATFADFHEAATKKDFEISAVGATCTYGKETSKATIEKAVTLDIEVTSKPYTAAQAKAALTVVQSASKKLHFKISSFPGLGSEAFYFSLAESGFFGQGISAVSGTTLFGATVDNNKLTEAKLGQLAALASKL